MDDNDDDYVGCDIKNDVPEDAIEGNTWTYNYATRVGAWSFGNNGGDNDWHDNEEFFYELNFWVLIGLPFE